MPHDTHGQIISAVIIFMSITDGLWMMGDSGYTYVANIAIAARMLGNDSRAVVHKRAAGEVLRPSQIT